MTKPKPISIEELWRSIPKRERLFHPESLVNLPNQARRYLEGAIAPGTPLASAVRLWMHGEIKIGKDWHPFKGEEVICWDRGMIWRVRIWMNGLPIWVTEQVVDGVGAGGEDNTRSAVGRVQSESVWLPSVLCSPDISWAELDASQVQATFKSLGEPAKLTLTVTEQGILKQVKLNRWGNPGGGAFQYSDFGGIVEAIGTFDGYTIPTRLRVGWLFGSERFESEGEFFRCTIDKAIY